MAETAVPILSRVYNIDGSAQFPLYQPYPNCMNEHKPTCHVLVTFASNYSVHLP